MIKLYLLSTLELKDEKIFEAVCGKLDAGRLEKVCQAKRGEDKRLRAGAGLLLQYVVRKGSVFEYAGEHGERKSDSESPADEHCQELTVTELLETVTEPQPIALRYGPHGKPYFTDSEMFFSLSHSGEYVLCALSDREIGADIQMIPAESEKQLGRETRIAEKFFGEQEREFIAGTQKEGQRYRFYCLWAAKEAYTKFTGRGLGQGIDSFHVDWERGNVCEQPDVCIGKINVPQGYAAAYSCLRTGCKEREAK